MEKKLVAFVLIALLAGLGVGIGLGFVLLQQVSENKTWHFVVDFTLNENNTISHKFSIQGEKWRINWSIVWVEEPYPQIIGREDRWDKTFPYAECKGWTGIIVYDENNNLISRSDIALSATLRSLPNPLCTIGNTGDNWQIWFENPPEVKGIHYENQGGRFQIELEGVVTPIALTIESYQ